MVFLSKGGQIPIIVDFTRLGDVRITGELPMPRIDEVLDPYCLFRVSMKLTTFYTIKGLFEGHDMSQWISSATGIPINAPWFVLLDVFSMCVCI